MTCTEHASCCWCVWHRAVRSRSFQSLSSWQGQGQSGAQRGNECAQAHTQAHAEQLHCERHALDSSFTEVRHAVRCLGHWRRFAVGTRFPHVEHPPLTSSLHNSNVQWGPSRQCVLGPGKSAAGECDDVAVGRLLLSNRLAKVGILCRSCLGCVQRLLHHRETLQRVQRCSCRIRECRQKEQRWRFTRSVNAVPSVNPIAQSVE